MANFAIGPLALPASGGGFTFLRSAACGGGVTFALLRLRGEGSEGGREASCDGNEIEIARPGTIWRLCGGICDEPPPCQGQQPAPAGRAGCATTDLDPARHRHRRRPCGAGTRPAPPP